MDLDPSQVFSRSVSCFKGHPLPEEGWLVGYAALIEAFDVKSPLPEKLSAISYYHKRYETDTWRIFTPRYTPEDTLEGHLTFALKHEGVDLMILKILFQKIGPSFFEMWIRREPLGQYVRRIWFLYEWLIGHKLSVADLKTGNFIDLLDSQKYYVGFSEASRRHRVRNNLPGVPEFCPLIRRTETLDLYMGRHLSERAYKQTGAIHPDVLARAAAFLVLKDSRASFEIEGESPGKNRTERWGRAIGQAGLVPLSVQELVRLQSIVIEDYRFVVPGLRQEGGFIGVHERTTGTPLPDHISARPEDVPSLMEALIQTYQRLKKGPLDAVLAATLIAFGFVFIHPFVDGNGRLHRYLIHHILAENGFAPQGIVFPISTVILNQIDAYRKVLESYSRPRLEWITWRPTENGNVEVLNETKDLYCYFDATRHAEFLYVCVAKTIDTILPEEISYLEHYDQLKTHINEYFDFPNPLVDLLIRFLHQNKGVLSKRARDKEFAALSEKEILELQEMYRSTFMRQE